MFFNFTVIVVLARFFSMLFCVYNFIHGCSHDGSCEVHSTTYDVLVYSTCVYVQAFRLDRVVLMTGFESLDFG